MSLTDAVTSCFRSYATFSGRARRSEYWYFYLFTVLLSIVTGVVDAVVDTRLFTVVGALAVLVPTLAVTWRRLHDTGRSGGWFFIVLIPLFGAIVLLVFLVTDTEPGPVNRFGASPKALPIAAYGSVLTQPGFGAAVNPQFGPPPQPPTSPAGPTA